MPWWFPFVVVLAFVLWVNLKDPIGAALARMLRKRRAQPEPVTHYVSLQLLRPEQQGQILPYVDSTTLASRTTADLCTPLCDELSVYYTILMPQGRLFLASGTLRQLGLNRSQLAPLARANLDRLVEQTPIEIQAPFSFVTLPGAQPAALMLVDALWDKLEAEHGPLWAAVPEAGLLIVGPLTSIDSSIRSMVRGTYENNEDQVAPQIFVRDAGRWVSASD